MNSLQGACVALVCCLQIGLVSERVAAQTTPTGQLQDPALSGDQQGPVLMNRPAPPPNPTGAGNRIQLDVVVTDAKGNPITGLTEKDFTVLDEKHRTPIVSFHAYDEATQNPKPTEQVILVLDTVNIDFHQVAYVRDQMAKFFAANGGHLAEPVSMILLTDTGLRGQPMPTTDGNAEIAELSQVEAQLRSITRASGVYGAIERFEISLKAMSSIIDMETGKPGRKMVVWIGPGWPLLSGLGFQNPTEKQQQWVFDNIVAFSTRLRENQITLYNVSSGEVNDFTNYYQSFLKGVRTPRQEDNGDLDVKVLTVQTGGLVEGPNNDLTGQIERCVGDAAAYYTIEFQPPRADKPDEYHDLKVQVERPKVTVRTSTGYYNQPPGTAHP